MNMVESKKRFDDGAQYRFEVPGIQKPEALNSLIDALDDYELVVHRVTQTKGIMLLTDSEIEEAIKFLEKSIKIKNLTNKEECENIFKNFVAGEYEVLFENIEEIKDIITQHIGNNCYDWFIYKNEIEDIVKKVATKKYSENFYKQVFTQIDKMAPEKTKVYLKELIKNEPLVGVKILKNQ